MRTASAKKSLTGIFRILGTLIRSCLGLAGPGPRRPHRRPPGAPPRRAPADAASWAKTHVLVGLLLATRSVRPLPRLQCDRRRQGPPDGRRPRSGHAPAGAGAALHCRSGRGSLRSGRSLPHGRPAGLPSPTGRRPKSRLRCCSRTLPARRSSGVSPHAAPRWRPPVSCSPARASFGRATRSEPRADRGLHAPPR
jgi:hypothetical protein